ncbi:putative FAD-binding PCMH-type domain-containing protein [Seiridium unicorne]|uniref:FAD-binding PCMH-type domain-containing protein n=1 Tax=Seiridium unicorne TaxID=138068 RepID=A0ABR2VB53_9PEZI
MRYYYVQALVLSAAAAARATSFDAQALFGPHVSPSTEIACKSDADFSDVASPRWSSWDTPGFVAAIKPVTEADVQTIVKIAAENNISFLATTNGHGTATGYGNVQNALNINLGNFNSVSIDAASNRLTAGGGVKFGDLFEPLSNAGKVVPTGNAVCVGLLGATVGGGIGVLTGLHGLTLDALQSARIVTSSGELVTASKTSNPDLFWAIRGAGANFGIITSATYEIYDQPNGGKAVFGSFVYPAASNVSVWQALQSFDEDLPQELAMHIITSYNHTTNQPAVIASVVYFGSSADAQPYMNRFLDINPISSSIRNVSIPDVFNTLSVGQCVNGARVNTYTVGLGQTNVATFQDVFADMVDFYATHPDYKGVLVAQRYSNVEVLKTPESETAHPWRDTKTYMLLDNIYTDPSIDEDVYSMSDSLRSKFEATSGFSSAHIYLNYDFGDEGPDAKYGPSNLPKLRALKALWDPQRRFGTPNPLY